MLFPNFYSANPLCSPCKLGLAHGHRERDPHSGASRLPSEQSTRRLQAAVAALALSRQGPSTSGQLGSVLSQAAKARSVSGLEAEVAASGTCFPPFPEWSGSGWFGTSALSSQDNHPCWEGPLRAPRGREGRPVLGGALCRARGPLGCHSGDANRRRSVASRPWTLMTFLFPRCSTGSAAHWTPAHPQRLLHHQRARQERYAVPRAAPAAQGKRARVGGMSATILMRDLASASRLWERQLLAWAQRLCGGVAGPSEQALSEMRVVRGEETG